MEKTELENYLREGLSLRKISQATNKSLSTIRYWVSKYELKPKNYYNKWDFDKIKSLIFTSNSKSEVLEKMGLTINAGNFRTLKRYFNLYNVDNDLYKETPKRFSSKNIKYSDSQIFCENSQYNSAHLKNRVLKSNLLEYKCVCCGNEGVWNNEKLILQIDHVNGINNDNRIENLRFMCPNCHSQTDTFSRRKIK
jgi:Zn finger protein HypA/HybF involved in hydrogenase expression